MDLTTATPIEIDTVLAELDHSQAILEAKVDAELRAIHRGLGEKEQKIGRRIMWPTQDTEAIAAMRAKGDTLIGMMRTADSIVARYDAAVAALAANQAAQAPLNAEYLRRGGWTRFFAVSGGHVHSTMNCSACNNGRERTRFGWLVEWSGRNQAEAIAALAAAAHTLCSQPCCFPDAPVPATPAPRKTAAERAADKAAAERTARTEDPKLIADTNGEVLRVDNATLRTVRAAEIKAVDALWWAAYLRHVTVNEEYARQHEGYARHIAAALAHKRGTTTAAEFAALVVRALRKLRKDLGAPEVADPAAAYWTVPAAATLTPAMTTAIEEACRQQADHHRDFADMLGVRGDVRVRLYTAGLITHPGHTGHLTRAGYEAVGRLDLYALTREAHAEQQADTHTAAPAPMTAQPQPQHAGRDDAPTTVEGDQPAEQGRTYREPSGLALVRLACGSSSREAVEVVRRALVAVGQVTRDLDDRQLAELGRRLGTCRPARAAGQLHPFLAALLAQASPEGVFVRACCTLNSTDVDCAAVHPGFSDPSAAFAAIAAEIEAEAADPQGYLAAQLGAMDDAAAAGELMAWAGEEALGGRGSAGVRAAEGLDQPCERLDGAGESAEALTISDDAGSVTVTDPAGLLALIREYGVEMAWAARRELGRERETVWCSAHGDGAHFESSGCLDPHYTDDFTRARVNEASVIAGPATLAQIAGVLGVPLTAHAGVSAPRDGAAG